MQVEMVQQTGCSQFAVSGRDHSTIIKLPTPSSSGACVDAFGEQFTDSTPSWWKQKPTHHKRKILIPLMMLGEME
jgi:hypothetical protein